ncbi:MAG: hypothetical protein F4126_12795 [Acidimicrobiaceae bacterium]|nr:hypothetical protein [Acidimicrobiaceae bacterium]MYB87933.1 hypothetical protein [Acidimicrobiaceae bacterium]MYH94576.1 hypothetical protein [Acidimicrobiaceae bacterium]
MGFKEDADFARFVSMGAVGAAAVAHHLSTEHAHKMIELERYAMANKVWQTKVKRLRLPDLLCVRCGLRVEARTKSKLGIVLSHSDTAGRQWDAGGMRDRDLYAFLRADLDTFPPRTGLPAYFAAEALRATVHHARRSSPKAASEGSEVTLQWPCWVPSRSGRFLGIDGRGYIVYRDTTGRERQYWQWRRWSGPKLAYTEVNEFFEGGDSIVAGIVPVPQSVDCPGEVWDPAVAVGAEDEVDRYAGIKASAACDRHDLHERLMSVRSDRHVDWRVRLEAAVSLARLDGDRWMDGVSAFINDASASVEQRMEAILSTSELPTGAASEALLRVASDADLPPELRAAAAWGLGQGGAPRPDLLLGLVLDSEATVALHAIAAIAGLPESAERILVEWLNGSDEQRGDVAAHLLSRHRRTDRLLDAYQRGGRARVRALSAMGRMPREAVRLSASSRLTAEVVTLLEPMWYSQESWVQTAGHDGLEALEIQKVRFNPIRPGTPWETGFDRYS